MDPTLYLTQNIYESELQRMIDTNQHDSDMFHFHREGKFPEASRDVEHVVTGPQYPLFGTPNRGVEYHYFKDTNYVFKNKQYFDQHVEKFFKLCDRHFTSQENVDLYLYMFRAVSKVLNDFLVFGSYEFPYKDQLTNQQYKSIHTDGSYAILSHSAPESVRTIPQVQRVVNKKFDTSALLEHQYRYDGLITQAFRNQSKMKHFNEFLSTFFSAVAPPSFCTAFSILRVRHPTLFGTIDIEPREKTYTELMDLLPEVMNLMEETHRIMPSTPVVRPRRVTRDDVGLDKGTHVLPCPRLHNRNPNVFTEPDQFCPGRTTRAYPYGNHVRSCYAKGLMECTLFLFSVYFLKYLKVTPHHVEDFEHDLQVKVFAVPKVQLLVDVVNTFSQKH